MSGWLAAKGKSYGGDEEPAFWTMDRDALELWVADNPPQEYETLSVYAMHDDGAISYEDTINYVPDRYYGLIGRCKVTVTQPGIHRVPIDCSRPHAGRELTEKWPMRLVENACCGTDENHPGGQFFDCHCKGWWVMEGSVKFITEWATGNGWPVEVLEPA